MKTSHSIDLNCPACGRHGLVIDAFGWLHCSGCCSLSPEAFEAILNYNGARQEKSVIDLAVAKAEEMAQPYGFTIHDLRGPMRTHEISALRQEIFYDLHKNDGLSFNQIAQIFNKDHSSIRYAVKKVADALMDEDA